MSKDPFFSATHCQRCGAPLEHGRIMSMYNEQVICMACKEKETQEFDYAEAVEAEHHELLKDNRNFKGIGWKGGHK